MRDFEKWVLEQPVWLHIVLIIVTFWLWGIVLIVCKVRQNNALNIQTTTVNELKVKKPPKAITFTEPSIAEESKVEVQENANNSSLLLKLNWVFGAFIFVLVFSIFVVFYSGFQLPLILCLIALLIIKAIFFFLTSKIVITQKELELWNSENKDANAKILTQESAKKLTIKFLYWVRSLEMLFQNKID